METTVIGRLLKKRVKTLKTEVVAHDVALEITLKFAYTFIALFLALVPFCCNKTMTDALHHPGIKRKNHPKVVLPKWATYLHYA